MKTRRRSSPRALLAVTAAAAGFACLLAWVGATLHVRVITGQPVFRPSPCGRCHGVVAAEVRRRADLHPDPLTLVATPDGETLFAACGPTRSVAVIDVVHRSLRATITLPGNPRGLALSPDGATLCVSLSDADTVAVIELPSRRLRGEIPVGASPAGLAFDATGRRLFVANGGSDDISVVDLEQDAELFRVPAGRDPQAVACSPDGTTVAVVSRMAGIAPPDRIPQTELTLLDAHSGRATARIALESCHLTEGLAFSADGRHVLLPTVRVRNLLPILQVARGWVMSSVLAVVEVATGRVSMLPLEDPGAGFADPSGIALSRDGQRAWIAGGGADRVGLVDLPALLELAEGLDASSPERLSWTRRYVPSRFATGDNPRGLAVVGTGAEELLAVAERLDDSVALFGTAGELVARIPVGVPRADDAVRRGDRVFHEAGFAFQASFSCRSCHPDGHTDGLTYDFDIDGVGKNVVLNRSLRGVGGTGPFKWIGLNPTLQRQCGPRFAMVLTRADPFPEEQLEDLVAYLESLPSPRPDPRTGRVGGRETGAVARGRAIFERRLRKDGTEIPPTGRCVNCHRPPLYTNRSMADVGTQSAGDKSGQFDVPHLSGIASKAPYLHDGRALSLEEIWTQPGVGDQHGVVTDLSKADLNDLVEFMRGL